MKNKIWSFSEIDEMLELLLPCKDQIDYERTLVQFGREKDRTAGISIREGDQFLRRRITRRSDYQGPCSETSRTRRDKLPFTWMERRILSWFLKEHAESKNKPTEEYLAVILQRSPEEIYLEIEKGRKTRNGIPGFILE